MQRINPALIIGFAILLIFVAALLGLLFTGWNNPDVRDFVMKHFVVIVCLPTAGLFAFVIVAAFQVAQAEAGQVKFKALGMEFSGVGGSITMWIAAFLAIAIPIGLFF